MRAGFGPGGVTGTTDGVGKRGVVPRGAVASGGALAAGQQATQGVYPAVTRAATALDGGVKDEPSRPTAVAEGEPLAVPSRTAGGELPLLPDDKPDPSRPEWAGTATSSGSPQAASSPHPQPGPALRQAGHEAAAQQEASPPPAAGDLPEGLHHLTRHWLPEDERGESVLQRFGAPDLESARQAVRIMGQRDLRAAFQRVYGSPTQSFNNNWLRRKLLEALGLRASASRPGVASGAPAAKRVRRTSTGGGRPRGRPPGVGQGAPAAAGSAPAARPGSPARERVHRTRHASAAEAEAAAFRALDTIAGAAELISPLVSPLGSPVGMLSPVGSPHPPGRPLRTTSSDYFRAAMIWNPTAPPSRTGSLAALPGSQTAVGDDGARGSGPGEGPGSSGRGSPESGRTGGGAAANPPPSRATILRAWPPGPLIPVNGAWQQHIQQALQLPPDGLLRSGPDRVQRLGRSPPDASPTPSGSATREVTPGPPVDLPDEPARPSPPPPVRTHVAQLPDAAGRDDTPPDRPSPGRGA